MSNTSLLRQKAVTVYDERTPGKNTQVRVGDVLIGIIDEIATTQTAVSNIEQTVINEGGIGKVQKVTVTEYNPGNTSIASIDVEYKTKTDTYVLHVPQSITNEINKINGDISTINTSVTNNSTTIENHYQTILNKISQERQERQNLIDGLDATVKADLKGALTDANWLQQNLDKGKLGQFLGWSDDIESYLSIVGIWDEDHGDITTEWSEFIQGKDSLLSSVSKLFTTDDGLATLLGTKINQTIAKDIAQIDLSTEYVEGDNLGNVFRWILSGLKVETDGPNKKTIAQLLSAAKNGSFDALADVKTAVDMLNGRAKAALSASVNDAFAQYFADATGDEAQLGYFTDLKDVAKGFASLLTKVNNDSSETTLQNRINNFVAGLTLKTELGSAIAGLRVSDSQADKDAWAEIVLAVKDGIGTLNLTADIINTIARDYVVRMDKLVMANSNFYMHSLKANDQDPTSANIGFEMISAASIDEVNSNGTFNYTEPATKFRLYYDYAALTKLSCDHIIMSNGNQTSQGGGTSNLKMEKGTQFLWYDQVYTENNVYRYKSNNTADQELGSITFGANGKLVIHGDIELTGHVTVNNTQVH